MHIASTPHGAGAPLRLAALALAVTAVAVVAGMTLAELRGPAGSETAASATATDEALALAARSRHSPLAESAPAVDSPAAAGDGEPLIESAE